MLQPQDLPGRYGRVVHAIDHLLQIMDCESVLAGGWAVWRHGYSARVTQDLDIVLPANRVEEFMRVASVSGFKEPPPKGRWPKLLHKETDVTVDILPETMRENMDKVDAVREHLAAVHADYTAAFDRLVERAREQEDA